MEGKTISNLPYIHYITRGFIDLFSRRAIGFHRQAKLLKLNFLCKKNVPLDGETSRAKLSSQPGGQFACCPAFNETST